MIMYITLKEFSGIRKNNVFYEQNGFLKNKNNTRVNRKVLDTICQSDCLKKYN